MKTNLLLLFFLAIFCFTSAQEYTFGIRGGLNQYTIGELYSRGGSIAVGKANETFYPNKDIGYQFGGYFKVSFGKLFLQPEINYVSSKSHYDLPKKKSFWKTSKIDVPILIGYEVFDPISIYVGPGFNFFNTTTLDGVQVTSFSDGGPDMEKSTFNINFGIKVEFKGFGLDLRYESGQNETMEELLDINNNVYGTNLADLRAYKPHVVSLSIYLDIFNTDGEDIGSFFSDLFKGDNCWCPKN